MIILYAFLSIYALWIFYVCVMALKRSKDVGTLPKTALVFGVPVLIIGYAMDVAVNIVILPFIFLDRPRSWTVTGTLKYHLNHGEAGSWREKVAAWFCGNLLNAFDPDGKHC